MKYTTRLRIGFFVPILALSSAYICLRQHPNTEIFTVGTPSHGLKKQKLFLNTRTREEPSGIIILGV